LVPARIYALASFHWGLIRQKAILACYKDTIKYLMREAI
jgi:hypothetical protein